MKNRPDISDLEFVEKRSYSRDELSDDSVEVFDDLDINIRTHDPLVFRDTETGEDISIKFVGMNFYPDDKDENPEGAKDCFQQDMAAIGWYGKNPDSNSSADSMKSVASTPDSVGRHERDAAHFLLWLNKDDIIVTPNDFGQTAYHYAWVTSEPKHYSEAEDEERQEALERNSFGFYREVEWLEVPQEAAPGPVTSTIIRGSTLVNKDFDPLTKHQIVEEFDRERDSGSRIDDKIEYGSFDERLRNLGGDSKRENSNQLLEGLSTSSSHNGLEDVVCSYIQHETGAKLKPATQYNPVVEYLFRGVSEDGDPLTFGVQVKSGDFDGNISGLKEFARNHDRLYLFSAEGDSIDGENIVNLDAEDITEYVYNRPQELDPTELDRLRRRAQIYEIMIE